MLSNIKSLIIKPSVASIIMLTLIFTSANALVAQENGYKVTLKMPGKTDSAVIMGNYWADRSVAFDTGIYNTKKKEWVFEGPKKADRGLYFLIFKDRTILEFVMADEQEFTILGDTADGYLSKTTFLGSDENKRYAEYKKITFGYGKQLMEIGSAIEKETENKKKEALEAERKGIFEKRVNYMKDYIAMHPKDIFANFINAIKPIDVPDFKKPNGNIDTAAQYYYYKDHYWDNFNFSENGLVRTPDLMLFSKVNNFFENIVPQHPDSIIRYADELLAQTKGAKELDKYFIFRITQLYDTMQLMCMDKVFVSMVDKYYLTGRAFWTDSATKVRMKKAADDRRYTTCGATALDLNYFDIDSVPQRLYDHIGKKYTILVFYDPTCGHCKKELPIIHEVFEQKKSEGWTVYAISAMNKKKEWLKYIKEENPTWTDMTNVCDVVPYQLWVDNREKYNIYSNPTILILNSKKEVIAKKIPAANIIPFIEQYEKVMARP